MNNGKYQTEDYRRKQAEKADRLFGQVLEHKKSCACCNKEFIFVGRKKTKAYEKALFCSRSCANNRQTWWNDNATHYRTIALRHWDEKCVICSFDKVVAIHHVDENKDNNEPRNLVPLCPNHHEMVHHSKWAHEVSPVIQKCIAEKFPGD